MKKQDNESLIQELTKRLDWYIMKASDEEFDADEVQTLMKLLDNLKTEEDNVDCLLYTSPSPRDPKTSRMPSSA